MTTSNKKQAASSCSGLTYFTSVMRDSGRPPLCIGRRGTVTSGLPQKEVVERSASKASGHDNDFSFACFGYSQTTAKMEREGALPLCDVGIKLIARRAPEESTTSVEEQPSQVAESRSSSFDAWALATRASTALMNFWRKAFTDYPNKWLKFNRKMFAAMQKHTKYMGKMMYRFGVYATSWWPNRP